MSDRAKKAAEEIEVLIQSGTNFRELMAIGGIASEIEKILDKHFPSDDLLVRKFDFEVVKDWRGSVWVVRDGQKLHEASDEEISMWQELARLRAAIAGKEGGQ